MEQRIEWVDYAKALAIFSVVLLHTHADMLLSEIINGYVMPLFFFISGYLFSYRRNPAYGPFARKRCRQLIVPYLWLSVLSYLCWLIILRHYGNNPADNISWYMPIAGCLAGIPKLMIYNIPLWSLLTFYVVEMIFYPCGRRFSAWLETATATVILAIAYYFFSEQLAVIPMVLVPALAGMIFYSLGHALRTHERLLRRLTCVPSAVVALIGFSVAIWQNSEVEFYICAYGDFLWFMVSSLCGIVVAICLCRLVSKLGGSAMIRFISENTLLICGFHLLVFAAVKGFALLCLDLNPEELTGTIWRGLLFSSVCFTLTLPLCYIVHRHLRFLVDK